MKKYTLVLLVLAFVIGVFGVISNYELVNAENTNSSSSTGPSIVVTRPNADSVWTRGTTQKISWQDNTNISTHEIKLYQYQQPCITNICNNSLSSLSVQSYTIANTQGSSYDWIVGNTREKIIIPDGLYMIKVCETGSAFCGSSSYFDIVSSAPTIPVPSTPVPSTEMICPNGNTLSSNCETAPSGYTKEIICPNGNTLSSNCTLKPSQNNIPQTNANPPIKIPPVYTTGSCSVGPWQVDTNASPKLFNVDFGVWIPSLSTKTGSAIVGSDNDFWNVVGVPWCDAHNKTGLKNADGSQSSIVVEMQNLGGAWSGNPGISDPMLKTFSYPANNKGGNAYVTLNNVPVGNYDLYLYNKTGLATQNGDYTLIVGGRNYGRKLMTTDLDSSTATTWQENNQFVIFKNVVVNRGDKVGIIIQPSVGGLLDAQISGFQLAPAGTPVAVQYTQYQYQRQNDQGGPVISGVSGPQSLNVNQNGTWVVKAYSRNGGNLSYSVVWGDETTYASSNGSVSSAELKQSATFTHNYSQVGIYNPVFTVTNESGQTAQTSLSVRVGNVTGINPQVTVSSSGTDVIIDPSLTSTSNVIFIAKVSGGSGQYKYYWSFGDGNISDGTILSAFQGNQDTMGHRYTTAGTYYVSVYVVDSDGKVSNKAQVTVNARLLNTRNPSLTVLSPNGGERIQKGSTYRINWVSDGINQVYIKLRKGTDTYYGSEGNVAYAISNRGYFDWNVPTTLPDGSDYAVRVLSYPNGNVLDDSNSSFTITSDTNQQPSINVLNPNGGSYSATQQIPYKVKVQSQKDRGSVILRIVSNPSSSSWNSGNFYDLVSFSGFSPSLSNYVSEGSQRVDNIVPGKYYLMALWVSNDAWPNTEDVISFSSSPFTITSR